LRNYLSRQLLFSRFFFFYSFCCHFIFISNWDLLLTRSQTQTVILLITGWILLVGNENSLFDFFMLPKLYLIRQQAKIEGKPLK
jgi:hypothetical protein